MSFGLPGASMPGKEWTIPSDQNKGNQGHKEILLVFLRAPEKGRVKTRLARDIGDSRALALYKTLVDFTLTAASAGFRETWICYFPMDKKDLITDWLGGEYTFLAQSGRDLGRRMANAMAAAFDDGADRVVLVGTDIPQIRASHIDQAFGALIEKDVVLGPSEDGGYWLVGCRSPGVLPAIFQARVWGSDSVFSSTVEDCCHAGLAWEKLAVLRDVDTVEDLAVLGEQGINL